jgi:ABC-type dipeptide/oligopeptide/nickel transport system permease component
VTRRFVSYAIGRLASGVLLVFVVSSAALVVARLAPGDVTSELVGQGINPETIRRERVRLGLDRPILAQYVDWARRAARLDLGESYRYQRPVRDLLGRAMWYTAILGAAALVVATLLGLPAGVLAGSRRGMLATLIRTSSVAILSVPPLVSALALAAVAAQTGWFPVGGVPLVDPAAGWWAAGRAFVRALAVPTIALALPFAAVIERLQAEAMAAALAEPHVLAARARGIPPARVLWRHAWPVAARPVVAVYGIIIGTLLSGSFAVEVVTSWPGLGQLMRNALVSRDVYLVAGCAAAGAVCLAAGTIVSDLVLVALDPRAREAHR